MKKAILGLLVALVILISVFLVVIVLLSTNERLDRQEPVNYKSIDEFKETKLEEAFERVIDRADRKVIVEFTEEELRELLALIIADYEKSSEAIGIRGYDLEVAGERIKVSIDSYLYKLLPVQYVVEIAPSIENNRISLFVEGLKVGKLNAPKSMLLKRIKAREKGDFFVDLQKQSITLINKYPEQITFKSVEVDEKTVKLDIALSINTLKDLINVLGTIMSDDLEALIEKIPIDEIKDAAMEQVKNIAIAQISSIGSSIKKEAIKSLTSYAQKNINSEKLKEVFTKENVSTIVEKAKEVIVGDSNGSGSSDKAEGETTLVETIKNTLVEEVKNQIEKQDEGSKLNMLKNLLDKYKNK